MTSSHPTAGPVVPTFEISKGDLAKATADLLVIGATQVGEGDDARADLGAVGTTLAEAIDLDLAAELDALSFNGASGSTARIPTRGAVDAPAILVVGLGPADNVDGEALRNAAGTAAAAAEKQKTVATTLPSTSGRVDAAPAVQAVVEGFVFGSYRFTSFKSEASPSALETVGIHLTGHVDKNAAKDGIAVGEATSDAVVLARDLVNSPSGDKRPPALADRVRDLCKGTGIKVKVLDENQLTKGGYGGLLGVGGGSDAPPRLVELSYSPSGAKRHVALVGKGITFDSGGLSLKPSNSMMTMKMDMAGAASVLATTLAAARLGVDVKITGLLALAENMPSGTAIRPGDVLTIHGGKTVEVLNTDAEGRLVLADTLVHASEAEPDVIVDLATLTGAVVVALGPKIGGLMSTDDDLADQLLAAAQRTGEVLWRLPVASREYGDELKGDVGDIKNAGWKGAGTIRAGLFLHEFVGQDIPWAHLDIAGIAWTDNGAGGYQSKGATGSPVRTLVDWLRNG